MRDLKNDELENLKNDNLKKSPDFEYAIHDKYISDLSKNSFKINDIIEFIINNFPGAKDALAPNNRTQDKATYSSANIKSLRKYISRFLQKNFQLSQKKNSSQLNYVISDKQLKKLYNNPEFQEHLKYIVAGEKNKPVEQFKLNELVNQHSYVANQLKDVIISTQDKDLLQQKILEFKKEKIIELLFDKYFDFDEIAFLNAYKKDPTTDMNNFFHKK